MPRHVHADRLTAPVPTWSSTNQLKGTKCHLNAKDSKITDRGYSETGGIR